ncbi:MAG: UPF0175 family protein [Oculatellaceae cyanobacterium Prado106]|nr:UPF0175 family protein [Oculatellaceae cyanobacterium Prado106]
MQINLDLPQDIEQRLQPHLDSLSRCALEAIALEAYKARLITTAEVQQMLKLPSRLATDAFLKQHEAFIPYTLDEIQQDIEAIAPLLSR